MDDLIRREDALLPCPFCGGEAEIGHHAKGRPGAWENAEDFWVFCETEDCNVHVGMCETRSEAIASWNRRALPAAPQGWQPMATAPKDGTCVLGSTGGNIPFVMAWCDDLAEETGSGWFTFNRCYEETIQRRTKKPWKPTHWQPLPAPVKGE